ncbi:hypothetical protein PanWU01x14_368390, partial [Parasponia andersonii]
PFEIDSIDCLMRLEKEGGWRDVCFGAHASWHVTQALTEANSKGDGRIDEEEWKEH